MPTAFILSPREGETVNDDNVVIFAAYADFTAATELKCKIAHRPDNPDPVNTSGLHIGDKITAVPLGAQTVLVFTDPDGDLAQHDNVNVVSGETPVPIDKPVLDIGATTKKIKKVEGKVASGSTAAYVVAQVVEVNAKTGLLTIRAAGATTVDAGKKWKVDIAPVTLDIVNKHIQYFVRAFAYTKDQQLLGVESTGIEKD
jgi:hypothetical protein